MNRRAALAALAAALVGGCSTAPPPVVAPAAPVPTAPPVAPPKPVRLGLALGGGAAKGFAHIGVIQVLEEAGIRPSLVVGTSAGSLVAALYASGLKGAPLQALAESMDEAMFADWRLPLGRPGLLRGEALARFVSQQVKGRQIQELPLSLGIVATNLHSGQAVLFQRGDVATAVRASSAVPAVFQPVSVSGQDYVDGGLVSPVPVRFARQMGADVVLAVDISTPPQANPANDLLQVLLQTFNIMGQSINDFELRQADVVVKPTTTGLSSASFASRTQAIAAGRLAMQGQLAALRTALARKAAGE